MILYLYHSKCCVRILTRHWLFQSHQVLHKYVALYAAHLLKNENVIEALELYLQHGTRVTYSSCEVARVTCILKLCFCHLCRWVWLRFLTTTLAFQARLATCRTSIFTSGSPTTWYHRLTGTTIRHGLVFVMCCSVWWVWGFCKMRDVYKLLISSWWTTEWSPSSILLPKTALTCWLTTFMLFFPVLQLKYMYWLPLF